MRFYSIVKLLCAHSKEVPSSIFVLYSNLLLLLRRWWSSTDDPIDALETLDAIKPPELKFHEISKNVNNPENNDPALIKPIN